MKQIIRQKAKVSKIVISKENIDNFEFMGNKRDIRKGNVSKLYKLLEKGQHFESPLVTSTRNNKERILDGNHRIEAIKKLLENNPTKKIEVEIFKYDGLTDQEEKETYTAWNSGLRQSTNDFIKQYWQDIPIIKQFKNNGFPCGVSASWANNSIEFKMLVQSYFAGIQPTFIGGFQGSSIEFIEESKKINIEDYKIMKAFMKEYIPIFGNPDKKNLHYRNSAFCSLFRIWVDNFKTKTPEEMKKAFIRVRGGAIIANISKTGASREMTVICRNDLLREINGIRTKNPFI